MNEIANCEIRYDHRPISRKLKDCLQLMLERNPYLRGTINAVAKCEFLLPQKLKKFYDLDSSNDSTQLDTRSDSKLYKVHGHSSFMSDESVSMNSEVSHEEFNFDIDLENEEIMKNYHFDYFYE